MASLEQKKSIYYYFMLFLLRAIVDKESLRGNDTGSDLYHLYILPLTRIALTGAASNFIMLLLEANLSSFKYTQKAHSCKFSVLHV